MQLTKQDLFGNEIPFLLRMLGATRICTRSIEFTWGYIVLDFGLEFCLDHTYEEGVPRLRMHFIFPGINIELPFLKQRYDDVNNSPRYGFDYHSTTAWWHWGLKMYSYYMPWAWTHVRHQVMAPQGWSKPSGEYEQPYNDCRLIEVHPYLYHLSWGEIQYRKATVYMEEREWRWKWLTWLPFPKIISTCINIHFDNEVGEQTGSWKGGTVGCSYEIRNGETMFQCLKRMEKERSFKR